MSRRVFRPAVSGGARVQVVIFDWLGTILVSRLPKGAHLARIYAEVAGIRVHPRRALEVTERVHRTTQNRTENPDADWLGMNRRILAELTGCVETAISEEIAAQVRPRVIASREEGDAQYLVRPSMRRLLARLRSRVPLGIASTQPWYILQRQLSRFRLRGYFHPTFIFGAHAIGGSSRADYVHKPTARFWELVRARVDAEACAIPLVGDSLATDAPAVQWGHPVLLYDPCGHQRVDAPLHPLLSFCRSTTQIEACLQRLDLPS